ncbi:hypothetical protein COCSUDRAFT_67224 [Coccomyxa subellipsoidea C-169]|uniref:Rhodanese domain-containing protein n=1 Tax=Coccomyxa subellipsoidea (strain C-169) TaxID=574566 RepID=I0YQU9_COCSC|nr:hypothetical protein COCSUDRAFT_67224 [Coccomyxa subellipsoidea C-169]EIE20768.1 hypothetical protein COCSUDRAFT_67224 [Coccomyxa subellipsoidea C-169]|eukprot:XP_005645312.1 hypothetical protein COCSUDRAFT_67224 [Coccomyxa subellipsoidea C-169]
MATQVASAAPSAETDLWGVLNDALKSPAKQAVPAKATPVPAQPEPILPPPPTPAAPAAATAESVSKPVEEAIRPVQGSSLDAFFSSKGDAGAGEGLSVPADATAGLKSALGGATDAVSSAQDAASAAASSLAEGASAQTKAAMDAASAAAGSLGASASEAASSLQGAAAGAASSLQEAASGALSSVNEATSGAVDSALSVYKELADGFGDATSSVQESLAASTSAASSAAEAAAGSLPEPVRSALSTVGEPLGNALSQVAANPVLLAATLGATVGLPALSWWRGRFGGYAGLLQPSNALDVLQNEDAVLVDMRSEDERVRDGVVGLRGALGKGAAVPLPYIGGDLARNVRNANQLSFEIAAAVVSGLAQVSSRTKLLVLDGGGSRNAIQLARTLRSVGLPRAYVVEGGYRQWLNEGLPAKQGASDYATSPADVIGERVALLAGTTSSSLGRPTTVVAAGAGAAVTYLALFKTLYLLRWLGVFGLLATAANRITSYNSANDFVKDLQSVSGSIGSLGSKAQKLVPSGIVSKMRGQSSSGSISAQPPAAVEEVERQKDESLPEREESESRPVSPDGEPSVVENSA